MKKPLLLFFFLIFFLKSEAQQPFCPKGAVWHYDWWSITGHWGVTRFEYTSDTIIKGINCKQIRETRYQFFYYDSLNYSTYAGDTFNIYQNGDTVFWYDNNSDFKVLFDFGAMPGDEWIVHTDTVPNCLDSSIFHVDSIGTGIINGDTLRWISIQPIANSVLAIYGKVYERAGALESYPFPYFYGCGGIIIDGPMYTFHCYEDSTFGLYNTQAKDCEYLLHIGVNEIGEKKFSLVVSPNPSSDKITISNYLFSNKEARIEIYNMMGEKVFSQMISRTGGTETINVSSFSAGVYLVQVEGEEEMWRGKMVKE